MNRRDFLKNSFLALLYLTAARTACFATEGSVSDTLLISLMLEGGPDFRHVFVPAYDSNPGSYGYSFWKARARSHDLDPADDQALEDRWNEYLHLQVGTTQFGIHPSCEWLKSQFDDRNVVIINNVFGSQNRDHAHSTVILESANMSAGANETDQSGWGGRLSHACGTNVVSSTHAIRQFCYGPHSSDPMDHDNSNVIDGSDSRKMGLYEYETDLGNDEWRWNREGIMSRALTSYYAAKAREMKTSSPYHQILQHEQSVRLFGRLVNERLKDIAIPETISNLYDSESPSRLNSLYFGGQIRNIYDTLACEDILNTNVISTDYTGWDHHQNLKDGIEPMIGDIFGTGRGLDVLFAELDLNPTGDGPRIVILVYGEFGRQLAANGGYGTDHGVGNSVMLIGTNVNGGIYGDMFPQSEIDRFTEPGTDIEGRTSTNQLIGRICEQVNPGSAGNVVPGWQNTDLEQGVDLSVLFS